MKNKLALFISVLMLLVSTGVVLSAPDVPKSNSDANSAAAPGDIVLYDQTDFPQLYGISSQNFEGSVSEDGYDSQGADDFIVPAADGKWVINTVDIKGKYYGAGRGPIQSVNVWFYVDANGKPGGASVYSAYNIVPATINVTDEIYVDLTIDWPHPAELAPGTYWVSVQGNMNYYPNDNLWGWRFRSQPIPIPVPYWRCAM